MKRKCARGCIFQICCFFKVISLLTSLPLGCHSWSPEVNPASLWIASPLKECEAPNWRNVAHVGYNNGLITCIQVYLMISLFLFRSCFCLFCAVCFICIYSYMYITGSILTFGGKIWKPINTLNNLLTFILPFVAYLKKEFILNSLMSWVWLIFFFLFSLQIENHISDIDNWVRSVYNLNLEGRMS